MLGDPVNGIDPEGLANSGVTVDVGGGNTVRIDNPHVEGQQKHAHVNTPKGEVVVNQDGSQSHKSRGKMDNLNKKVKKYLRLKGFKIPGYIPPFIIDILIEVSAAGCASGSPADCEIYKELTGDDLTSQCM